VVPPGHLLRPPGVPVPVPVPVPLDRRRVLPLRLSRLGARRRRAPGGRRGEAHPPHRDAPHRSLVQSRRRGVRRRAGPLVGRLGPRRQRGLRWRLDPHGRRGLGTLVPQEDVLHDMTRGGTARTQRVMDLRRDHTAFTPITSRRTSESAVAGLALPLLGLPSILSTPHGSARAAGRAWTA
jgi:hypothetical protein